METAVAGDGVIHSSAKEQAVTGRGVVHARLGPGKDEHEAVKQGFARWGVPVGRRGGLEAVACVLGRRVWLCVGSPNVAGEDGNVGGRAGAQRDARRHHSGVRAITLALSKIK